MAKFTQGPMQFWPTHWAGGCLSWEPNRITIRQVNGKNDIAFIEHHGPGDGKHKYPTEEDYANARLYVKAPEMYASFDPDTLEAIADEIDCFEHSARAHALRVMAQRQRELLAEIEGHPIAPISNEIHICDECTHSMVPPGYEKAEQCYCAEHCGDVPQYTPTDCKDWEKIEG
jgi:hypothetical protein